MIIKGALRTLRRDGATAADVREAAADIDEEIERLNRVVNDVLDFARPIRFDRAPTDINALCRDAAARGRGRAADAAGRRSSSTPALPAARHRQRAAAHRAGQPADQRAAGRRRATARRRRRRRRRAVDAVDRAARRSPRGDRRFATAASASRADDLPHIFDPYFTTRRAGTGLGLPIAKNIVEGLGGTISVDEHAGRRHRHPDRARRRAAGADA